MFLEHQNSGINLPYHPIYNNGCADPEPLPQNKNDVSDFKAGQNTYVALPDSILLPETDNGGALAPRGQYQPSALRSRVHPPSRSTFLKGMHDDEEDAGYGYMMAAPEESSGVGSSIQKDEEVSQILKPEQMNQTIRSQVTPFKVKANETMMEEQKTPKMNPGLDVQVNEDEEINNNRTEGDIKISN